MGREIEAKKEQYINKADKKYYIAHYGSKYIIENTGGVEVVVAELSSRQADLGHSVTVYNRKGHHVSGAEFDSPKVKEWKKVRMKYVPTIPGKGLAAVSSSFFAAVFCAVGQYDVVHVHAEGPAAFCWIPKLFGKKIICTNHGLDWKRSKWQGGIGSKFIRFGEWVSARCADEIIVLSKDIQDYFKKIYKRDTTYIPNGVNRPSIVAPQLIQSKFELDKDSYILYLSRIVSEKRVDLLINAYKNLKTGKKLVIAGGASDSKDYLNAMKKLALNDERIIFTGFVQGRLKDELYSNAYIYVLPSDLEGMPLCLLEAMSYGNCCLTSDIPECANVIEHGCILFKKGDLNDLTEKLKLLCDSQYLVEKYKYKVIELVTKKYNWEEVVVKVLELYK